MSASLQNTKNVPTRWQNVKLQKMAPYVYVRYYRRQPGFSEVVPEHHFYINEVHSWGEVFSEQIDAGFWLLAMEIRGKANNHYILQPKRSTENYYSINFFSTSGRVGFQQGSNIQWVSDQVSFLGPSTLCGLYQEKGAVLRCCRMIFTADYLARLISSREEHLSGIDLQSMMAVNAMDQLHRIATKAEIFLQFRLFNVLKYGYGKYHYRASVFSNVFELTAFFLNYLPWKARQERSQRGGGPISC